MQYTAIVQRQSTGGFHAIAPAAPGCSGRGRTRSEALDHLKGSIEGWLRESEITTINVSIPTANIKTESNPWVATAGIFADDPTLESMLEDIYRARDLERPTAYYGNVYTRHGYRYETADWSPPTIAAIGKGYS